MESEDLEDEKGESTTSGNMEEGTRGTVMLEREVQTNGEGEES